MRRKRIRQALAQERDELLQRGKGREHILRTMSTTWLRKHGGMKGVRAAEQL
jgi:hypothetical protein